ncbi:bifunctional diguanylate cyclase/phosphodiesterase [Neorhizobium galegae]|uniref:putative bifunctional diguanylate cyclase/phosphodiesterase n=2 Tax=Neorhizobium galegae TaxID=399 RepID=UPI001353BD37|nr:EAL domain-containing protein [Neorhizobium galegae]KAB1113578.1 EAL domain-containing protein [Neorhizobium galegae]MCM2496548.1 EAL domain-containing protein [Neorhizobium galegae]
MGDIEQEKNSQDLFEFHPEPAARTGASPDQFQAEMMDFTIMSVDDDEMFQNSLRLSLSGFTYRSVAPRILMASSANEAAKLLLERPSIAVLLLDVVMETDDAGLRLVRTIREVLGNSQLRIVLLTGQPGIAPMQSSLETYDIADYWLKTDLTNERLHSILTANLRTFEQIDVLNRARRGLQSIVEASNSLARSSGFEDFSRRMIHELAALLGVREDGIVCVRGRDREQPPKIIGSAGRFASALNQTLDTIDDVSIRDLIQRSLDEQASIETATAQVLFFPGQAVAPPAAAYIATNRRIDDTERELLRVFATNIGTGLINVALTSQLDRIAYEDGLLEIANGNALKRGIQAVIELPPPRRRKVLFIELNQYARSCVSLGVEQGDHLLRAFVKRLAAAFPPPCMIARLHEDVFAVLGPEYLVRIEYVNRLEAGAHSPEALFFGAEAASLDLNHFTSAQSVIAAGLLLLKKAGLKGTSGQLIEYDPNVEHETRRRFALSQQLYKALLNREISVVFQPQIDLTDNRIVGAEILARWTRPDGSVVFPADFIPLAEANGLIVPLGQQILEQACSALRSMGEAGFANVTIAVNVSPIQLGRKEFIDELIATTRRYGLSPDRLELEITETVAMEEHQHATDMLSLLRREGFAIAIDDFGTGYSSLAKLRSFEAATLKIDPSFIAGLGESSQSDMIVEMIIQLGERMNMRILAEGVETEQQAEWLRSRKCILAQGYLYARPEPFEQFLARLQGSPVKMV